LSSADLTSRGFFSALFSVRPLAWPIFGCSPAIFTKRATAGRRMSSAGFSSGSLSAISSSG